MHNLNKEQKNCELFFENVFRAFALFLTKVENEIKTPGHLSLRKTTISGQRLGIPSHPSYLRMISLLTM